MKTELKLIVTRDKKPKPFVGDTDLWPAGTDLIKTIDGHWHEREVEGSGSITSVMAFEFKGVFGFTPRKGSKRKIRISVEVLK